MKVSDAFPSPYLKVDDLKGRDVSLDIAYVQMEAMPDGRRKPVAYFVGKPKSLVLNKTNCRTITELAGTEEMDRWGGQRIVIGPAEAEFQGKLVPCIRVRRSGNQLKAARALQAPVTPPKEPDPPLAQTDEPDDAGDPF